MKSIPSQHFSAEESLLLIQNMIEKTRQDISAQSPYFLLWGWCAFLGCLSQFFLKVYFKYQHHYFAWFITIPCIIISLVFALRNRRRTRVKTYVNASMGYLWMGIGFSIVVLNILFIAMGYQNCFPFFILFYGMGSFVSGKILQFTPLVVGGVLTWCLSAVSVWFHFDYQVLFAAASLLFGYIIPGHLIAKNKKVN